MPRLQVAQSVAFMTIVAGSAADGVKYRIREIPGIPEQTYATEAAAISNSGDVCGSAPTITWVTPFVWNRELDETRNLGRGFCGLNDRAVLLNDSGCVVVWELFACPDADYWFLAPGGAPIAIPNLPGRSRKTIQAMNNLNEVLCLAGDSSIPQPYIWSPDGGIEVIDIGPYTDGVSPVDFNDNGWVVGTARGNGDPCHLFVWSPETGYRDLCYVPGMDGDPFNVVGISNGNVVAGGGYYETGYRAFVWNPAIGITTWLPLPHNGTLENEGGYAHSISDNGIVYGQSAYGNEDDGWVIERWIWSEDRGIRIVGPDSIDPCVTDYNFRTQAFHQGTVGPNNAGEFVATIIRPSPLNNRAILLTSYIPGDLDEDADCDLQDLAYQLANFGRTEGATYAAGDLDCDHDVDLEDLTILLSNFGETLP